MQNLINKNPAKINKSGAQSGHKSVYDFAEFKVAMANAKTYDCGCNLLWQDSLVSESPGVPKDH
eukprot:10558659-Alexandrium_andersonii.AAC.1